MEQEAEEEDEDEDDFYIGEEEEEGEIGSPPTSPGWKRVHRKQRFCLPPAVQERYRGWYWVRYTKRTKKAEVWDGRSGGIKRVLSPHVGGYLGFTEHGPSGTGTVFFHRLMASFLDGWQPGYEVDHGNGDNRDNSLDNLSWVSSEDNQLLKWLRNGLGLHEWLKLSQDERKEVVRRINAGQITREEWLQSQITRIEAEAAEKAEHLAETQRELAESQTRNAELQSQLQSALSSPQALRAPPPSVEVRPPSADIPPPVEIASDESEEAAAPRDLDAILRLPPKPDLPYGERVYAILQSRECMTARGISWKAIEGRLKSIDDALPEGQKQGSVPNANSLRKAYAFGVKHNGWRRWGGGRETALSRGEYDRLLESWLPDQPFGGTNWSKGVEFIQENWPGHGDELNGDQLRMHVERSTELRAVWGRPVEVPLRPEEQAQLLESVRKGSGWAHAGPIDPARKKARSPEGGQPPEPAEEQGEDELERLITGYVESGFSLCSVARAVERDARDAELVQLYDKAAKANGKRRMFRRDQDRILKMLERWSPNLDRVKSEVLEYFADKLVCPRLAVRWLDKYIAEQVAENEL
jgi:hypothetical protein